jgi:arsenate reductase
MLFDQRKRHRFVPAARHGNPAPDVHHRVGKECLMRAITIYGIKNCDTMKKARAWLDSHGVAYGFHDYKAEGIAREKLKSWSNELGWETLLNRAGTTFRKLPESDKEDLNERKAIALMLAQPSMIKRPVLDIGGKLLVGFKPEIYAREVSPSRASRSVR